MQITEAAAEAMPRRVVSAVSLDDGVAKLRVCGYVDASTAVELRSVCRSVLALGAKSVEIDCTGITFMGCSGVHILEELLHFTGERHGTVTLRNPESIIVRLLEVTGLLEELTIDITG